MTATHPLSTNGGFIDTDTCSRCLRERTIDLTAERVLVTDLRGSAREADLFEPVNCDGFGRIRHFRSTTAPGWPANSLPHLPACAALGMQAGKTLRAQMFQNAAHNWRCRGCCVPFDRLSADPRRSAWFTANELLDAWLEQDVPPQVIDLSGGRSDLVPEWTVWMIEALEARGLTAFLWGDDSLSTDYFFRFLTSRQQQLIASYPRYARVCCFKGFDESSFAFNTAAAPGLFGRQFELSERLHAIGMDLYAYVTFTTADPDRIAERMHVFCDRLQCIDPMLPLRAIPLEIEVWGPVAARMRPERTVSLHLQQEAIAHWNAEILQRFSPAERELPINCVPLIQVGAAR